MSLIHFGWHQNNLKCRRRQIQIEGLVVPGTIRDLVTKVTGRYEGTESGSTSTYPIIL